MNEATAIETTHSTHTPVPWISDGGIRVQGNSEGHRHAIALICPPPPYLTSTMYAQANARFIVRACNAHDELLAACEATANLIEPIGRPDVQEAHDMARAAIAKAEGATSE